MVQLTLKGKPVHTTGNTPSVHTKVHDFRLVDANLQEHSLAEFHGKRKILATVPSLDTGTCSIMTKHLNEFAKKHPDFVFIVVSCDLPFAQKRFCETEKTHNVLTLSMMRDKAFGQSYGLLLQDGPIAGLLARSLMVLDEKDHLLYIEVVPEITQEPDYHKAFEVLQGHNRK